jgi:hypothetical protein
MIGRLARRHRSVVAGSTGAGCSLQTAVDVAAYAFYEGVRTCQRETGFEVVEIGCALLRKRGPSQKQQRQGKHASGQSVLSHQPLALRGSASVEAERAQKGGEVPPAVLYESC